MWSPESIAQCAAHQAAWVTGAVFVGFVAALAAGVAVAAALVIVGKSRIRRAAGSAGLRLGQPDEAESR